MATKEELNFSSSIEGLDLTDEEMIVINGGLEAQAQVHGEWCGGGCNGSGGDHCGVGCSASTSIQ